MNCQPQREHRQKALGRASRWKNTYRLLRSNDQFANLVLRQTVERIRVGKKSGDIPRGLFVVSGESVVLLGEMDLEKESATPLQQASIEELLEEQGVEQQTKLEAEKLKVEAKDGGLHSLSSHSG